MFPLLSDLIFFLGYSPVPYLNLTPIIFGFAGILIAWNLFRYKFLNLVPIARSKLVEVVQDGWLVLDNENRLVDFNTTAQAMLEISAKNIIGQFADHVFEHNPKFLQAISEDSDTRQEINCSEPGGNWRYYEIVQEKLYHNKGHFGGKLIILHDVTNRKAMEESQALLIKDLKEALTQIKTLEGLIPICANCKKIRDDQGYWQEVEGYVMEHSHAEFSHSICPSCAKKLYPQYYDT